MKIDARRTPIYKYVYSLFNGKVTDYIYPMGIPTNLTEEAQAGGFMVINVGDIQDRSEMTLSNYAQTRVTVQMYVTPKGRGRIDTELYEEYETKIFDILAAESEKRGEKYIIDLDSILSTDDVYNKDGNNVFFLYIASFVLKIIK